MQKTIFHVIVPVLIIIATLVYSLFLNTLKILPNSETFCIPFNDSIAHGQSFIKSFGVARGTISLSYTLVKASEKRHSPLEILRPFAGILLYPTKPQQSRSWIFKRHWSSPFKESFADSAFDLANYDYITLKIKSNTSKTLLIQLCAEIPGVTEPEYLQSYLFFEQTIPLLLKKKKYRKKLKEFLVPEWWYRTNESRIHDIKIDSVVADKINFINIFSSPANSADVEDTIIIEEITFEKDRLKLFLFGLCILFLYVYGISVARFITRYKNQISRGNIQQVLPQKEIQLTENVSPDAVILLTYLGRNFHRSGLTLEATAKTCQLPVFRIKKILRTQFKLTFPQYMNTIRISEAKRLLRETKIKIIEIAHMVGYNSSPYFTRIFKSVEGLSPADYRKKTQE